MPACASSPILAVVDQRQALLSEREPVPVDLLAAMSEVTDPLGRRGVRHGLVTILAVAVGAVLAGARSYVAIAEWAHDLTPVMRLRLGVRRAAPSESTIRRTLQAVDADALDAVISRWLAARIPPPASGPRMIAVDGKTARGARGPDGRPAHLLAAFDQASGVVLGQATVHGKTNESPRSGRCSTASTSPVH